MKQKTLFKTEKTDFGGSLLKNKRKSKRPIYINVPVHLVLKADIKESGSLLKHRQFINEELNRWTKKFGITLYDHAICKDHLHLAIELTTIEGYKNFARTFNGRCAQYLKIKWTYRPFTKLVHRGKQFKTLLQYITQNHQEATGQRPYKERSRKIKHEKDVA